MRSMSIALVLSLSPLVACDSGTLTRDGGPVGIDPAAGSPGGSSGDDTAALGDDAPAAGPSVENTPAVVGDVVEGRCEDDARVWMEVDREGSRWEVEVEIEAWTAGEDWRLTITHNGANVLDERHTTGGSDGEFWRELSVPDRPGEDVLVARVEALDGSDACAVAVALAGG